MTVPSLVRWAEEPDRADDLFGLADPYGVRAELRRRMAQEHPGGVAVVLAGKAGSPPLVAGFFAGYGGGEFQREGVQLKAARNDHGLRSYQKKLSRDRQNFSLNQQKL